MLLTSDDIAARLRVSPHTVRRYQREGVLPRGMRIGGVYRWPSEKIDAWLAAGAPQGIESRPECDCGGGQCGRGIR